MSEHSNRPLGAAHSVPDWRALTERRWPLYAGAAVLAVLAIAWFDGGEEPLRPITQSVDLGEVAR